MIVPRRNCLGQGSVWTQITLRTGQPVAGQGQRAQILWAACGRASIPGACLACGECPRSFSLPETQREVFLHGVVGGGRWCLVGMPLWSGIRGGAVRITLGLCHASQLSCFLDLPRKQTAISALPTRLPGRPAAQGFSITRVGMLVTDLCHRVAVLYTGPGIEQALRNPEAGG